MGHSFPAAWVQGRGHRGYREPWFTTGLSCSEGQAVTGGCTKCSCGEFHELGGQLGLYARKTGGVHQVWCGVVWTGAAYLLFGVQCHRSEEWSIGRKTRLSQASQCCPAARLHIKHSGNQPDATSFGLVKIVASSRSPQIYSLSLGAAAGRYARAGAKAANHAPG